MTSFEFNYKFWQDAAGFAVLLIILVILKEMGN